MTAKPKPEFRKLTREECDALLAANSVARLAYVHQRKVDIVPINYAYAEGTLIFRTAPGTKVAALAHQPWVALEVDEVRGVFDWKSVVVRGTVYPLSEEGTDRERQAREAAVARLRELIPETLTPDDPVGFRKLIFQVHVDTVTGRESRTAAVGR